MRATKFSLLLATIYFVFGNIIGFAIYTNSIAIDNILVNIFLPYTFTWGISALVGADWLAYVFIIVAFAGSFVIFYPIGFFLDKRIKK